jgi:hypothetical protein
MKKLSVIILFAIAAFLFVGCSDDEATSLRWNNQSGSNLQDIQWVNNAAANQTWTGVVSDTTATDYREITKLNGTGECIFEGGDPATISLTPGSGVVSASTNSAQIEENVDATLIIDGAVQE